VHHFPQSSVQLKTAISPPEKEISFFIRSMLVTPHQPRKASPAPSVRQRQAPSFLLLLLSPRADACVVDTYSFPSLLCHDRKNRRIPWGASCFSLSGRCLSYVCPGPLSAVRDCLISDTLPDFLLTFSLHLEQPFPSVPSTRSLFHEGSIRGPCLSLSDAVNLQEIDGPSFSLRSRTGDGFAAIRIARLCFRG